MTKISFGLISIFVLSALIGLLAIWLPFNIWLQIWTALLLLDPLYLGVLYIGLGILFIVAFFIAKAVKYKVNFIIIAMLLIVAGILVLADPNWYYAVYFS